MSLDLDTPLFDGATVGVVSNGCLRWDTDMTPERREKLIAACRRGEPVVEAYGNPYDPSQFLHFIDGTDGKSTREPPDEAEWRALLRRYGRP